MPWYLYLAYKQLLPSGRKVGSIFFVLGVLGVALGVAVLLVVQSVMGGFGEIHKERILNTSGHLDINAGGYPYAEGWAVSERIAGMEGVVQVTPYAQGFVMVQRGAVPSFPAILGMEAWENPVFNLEGAVIAGSVEDLYDDTVLISNQLSRELGAGVGSELTVYSPVMISRLSDESVLLPRVFTVAGIYEVEWNPEYLPGVICTLATMQELYELGDALHGIAVRLEDGVDEGAVAAAMAQWLEPPLQVITWRERWESLLWVLDLEKTVMLYINLMIVAVAVFAIAVAQLLTVVRKTREIGLLQVLGGSRRGILLIYCLQGLLIGVVGVVVGIVLALALLAVRGPVIEWLSMVSGTRETLLKYYYFSNPPVRYEGGTFVFIGVAAVGLSVLASLVPALRAARLRPAETLRFEQ